MRSYLIKNKYIRKTGAAGRVLSRHDLQSCVVLRSCRKKLRFPAASFYTSKTSYCRFGPPHTGQRSETESSVMIYPQMGQA